MLTISKCILTYYQGDVSKNNPEESSNLSWEFLFLSAAGFKIAVSSPCSGDSWMSPKQFPDEQRFQVPFFLPLLSKIVNMFVTGFFSPVESRGVLVFRC